MSLSLRLRLKAADSGERECGGDFTILKSGRSTSTEPLLNNVAVSPLTLLSVLGEQADRHQKYIKSALFLKSLL